MDRRRVLRLGTGGLAAALAGCGLGLGNGSDDPATDSSDGADSGDGTGTAGTPTDRTATAEPTPTPTPQGVTPGFVETPTATTSATATPRPVAQVVTVARGERSFEPETFEISAGDTVVWVWHNTGHNVRPAARPQESDWRGTPGGDDELYSEGYEYSHTFDVPGEYEYYCQPHRRYGMSGSFRVID